MLQTFKNFLGLKQNIKIKNSLFNIQADFHIFLQVCRIYISEVSKPVQDCLHVKCSPEM